MPILSELRNGCVSFKTAWAIFRPDDILYTQVAGHGWLVRCTKTTYEQDGSGPYIEVFYAYTDHNGTDKGVATGSCRLHQKTYWASEYPAVVTSLKIFPRQFVVEQPYLESQLKERGQRFLELQMMSVNEYKGLAYYMHEPPRRYWHPNMGYQSKVWLPYTVSLSHFPMHCYILC